MVDTCPTVVQTHRLHDAESKSQSQRWSRVVMMGSSGGTEVLFRWGMLLTGKVVHGGRGVWEIAIASAEFCWES